MGIGNVVVQSVLNHRFIFMSEHSSKKKQKKKNVIKFIFIPVPFFCVSMLRDSPSTTTTSFILQLLEFIFLSIRMAMVAGQTTSPDGNISGAVG